MDISIKPVTLSVVTIELNKKKITGAVLDQIPRLDFCTLLVDKDGCYNGSANIVPVARFSLVFFVSSQMRVCKTLGYDSYNIKKMIGQYEYHEEAFLFTHNGQIYCDSFSLSDKTHEHDVILKKFRGRMSDCQELLDSANRVVDLHRDGRAPMDIIKGRSKGLVSLPRGRQRGKKESIESILAYWDSDGVLGFDASEEEVVAHELAIITKNHGDWDQYIESVRREAEIELTNRQECESDINQFKEKVASVMGEIALAPFVIFGC